MMNEHVVFCRHYSFGEPFQSLEKHDLIFDKGFQMWGNFFEFLSGESDGLRRKSTNTMKDERKHYWKEADFED